MPRRPASATCVRAAFVLSLATACGRGGPAAATSPTGSTSNASIADCIPSGSVIGTPITDPNGPYYHQVVVAHTTDGTSLTNVHQILDHASVPDGVRRADGTVLVYYVNGQDGAVWVARLANDSATVVGAISIAGVRAPTGVVDPDAMLQADGRVRLTYNRVVGADPAHAIHTMCIADSDDGIAFTVRAIAIAFTDGSHASDPSVRLYVCAQGIESYRSTNAGASWIREGVVVSATALGKQVVCDPSLIAGANLFVFKTQ